MGPVQQERMALGDPPHDGNHGHFRIRRKREVTCDQISHRKSLFGQNFKIFVSHSMPIRVLKPKVVARMEVDPVLEVFCMCIRSVHCTGGSFTWEPAPATITFSLRKSVMVPLRVVCLCSTVAWRVDPVPDAGEDDCGKLEQVFNPRKPSSMKICFLPWDSRSGQS